MKRLILLLAAFSLTIVGFSQTLTLKIRNIKTSEGQLQVAIFENQEQFDDEKPLRQINFDKTGMTGGSKTITFELKPGTYGITILDDEDKSNDMTYRFGIYPMEGVAFSNFKLDGMTKPDFTDFQFNSIYAIGI